MKAVVHIFLKPGVLDVQGKAVESALRGLGWSDVSAVRVGRVVEFDLAPDDVGAGAVDAKTRVESMCQRLLANPVIEAYRVEIAG